MRRWAPAVLAIALGLFLPVSAMAYTGSYTPGTGINGTVHDLATSHNGMNYTASPSDAPLNRICIFCHATHNLFLHQSSLAIVKT